jgi:transposase-like protein
MHSSGQRKEGILTLNVLCVLCTPKWRVLKKLTQGSEQRRKGVRKMAQEYKCNACGKTFNSERELQEHAKTCK